MAMPGVLLYRGYPVEQLAQDSSFMEVAYLLLLGELPSHKQLEEFGGNIRLHTMINENVAALLQRLSSQRPSDGDGVGGHCIDVGVLSRHDGHL